MKNIGKYTFECCGKRLRGKDNFCAVCGARADRLKIDASGPILIEIDKRARGSETQVRNLQAVIAELKAGAVDSRQIERLTGGASGALALKRLEKQAGGFARSALWYRNVERLISDLMQEVSVRSPVNQSAPPEAQPPP